MRSCKEGLSDRNVIDERLEFCKWPKNNRECQTYTQRKWQNGGNKRSAVPTTPSIGCIEAYNIGSN